MKKLNERNGIFNSGSDLSDDCEKIFNFYWKDIIDKDIIYLLALNE